MARHRLVHRAAAAALLLVATAGSAHAGLVSLPQATFGGSGIPNAAVAVTTVVDGNNTITLGLTAHQRYANPPLTNDGTDTFYALPGGDVLNGAPTLAVWNFAFYAESAAPTAAVMIELLYDFDPGVNTLEATLGRVSFPLPFPLPNGGAATVAQDSWNLGMAFLDAIAAGVVPPVFPSFNPNVSGQYSFVLLARTATGAEVGRTSIQVEVGAVPEPTTLGLLGLGLVALARRMRN